MSDIWSKVHALLVTGALSKGGTWGGPDCRAQLSMDIHLYESSFWVLMCIFTYFIFNINGTIKSLSKQIEVGLKASPMNSLSRTFEVIVGLLHFAMFAQLIYFKLSISSLTNMIQPCHVILLLEGIALLSTSSTGVYISIFILPALTGTLLAMLFPETTGLDQYLEMEAYWLQHYLIQAMPLYLLLRRNGLALQLCSYKTVRIGIWILYLLHFSVYEVNFKFFFSLFDIPLTLSSSL